MADKQIIEEIQARQHRRAERILREAREIAPDVLPATLAGGFSTAAECLREEADAIVQSKRRGWQSTSRELVQVAARLVGIAQDLDALVGVDIDAFVQPDPDPAPSAIADYISGRTDQIPPAMDGGPRFDLSPLPPDDVTVTITQPADGGAPVITSEPAEGSHVQNPFSKPEPAGAYLPFVGAEQHVRTFGQLIRPIWCEDLKHWSWSQLTTLEDCGLRYRLQRIEKLPQVPAWALVGGRAFHAAAEAFDRSADLDAPLDADALWREHFHATIAAEAAESGIPMGADGSGWRASKAGAEGYTWWLINGSRMFSDYVTMRRAELGSLSPLVVNEDGAPVIEWEYSREVPGPLGLLPVTGVIDRGYVRHDDAALLVRDLKTGSTPVDMAQLGEYAQAIVPAGSHPPPVLGQVYDARRNKLSEPIDLLATYPGEEYSYRYHAAESQRRGGVYSPRKSSFCGGCAVRYACPVGSR